MDASIDKLLYDRVRESGRVAASVAPRVLAILPRLSNEKVDELSLSIDERRSEIDQLVLQVEEIAGGSQVAALTLRIAQLWQDLAGLVARRRQQAIDKCPATLSLPR